MAWVEFRLFLKIVYREFFHIWSVGDHAIYSRADDEG